MIFRPRFALAFGAAVAISSGLLVSTPARAIDEDAVGRDYHRQLSKEYRVYENDRMTRIGKQVSDVAGISGVQFFGIDMGSKDQPNAFQIPNHIYATKSLLKDFDDVALTFIVAHELGHQAGHHLAKQMNQNQRTAIGAALLGAIFGIRSNSVGGFAINLAGGAIINQYSRGQEEEADLYGLMIIHDMGISFKEAAASFKKLGGDRSESRTLNALFGTHPVMRDRIGRAETADKWLVMRPVDIVSRGNRSVALVWPHPGEDSISKTQSELRTSAIRQLTDDGYSVKALGSNNRLWTKLFRLESLQSGDLGQVRSALGVDGFASANRIRGGKLEASLWKTGDSKWKPVKWDANGQSVASSLQKNTGLL